MVVFAPSQIIEFVVVVPVLGVTVMRRVELAVHPCALVPITVYVVVLFGETVIEEPVNPPGCHK